MKLFLRWLASFRLRILFRVAFFVLISAVVVLAVAVLQGEKQRAYSDYLKVLAKTKEQIVTRLRHPSGQLALLNPARGMDGAGRLYPVLLPFPSIDYDDQNKVKNAIEMADCLVRFAHRASLCVAIGNNPWMGGFIYAAGTFASGPLAVHKIGDRFLDGSHRMRVGVFIGGKWIRWIAPFETLPPKRAVSFEGIHGRLTGYAEIEGRDYENRMPVKEFRGWLWQESRCLDARQETEDCERQSFFSMRLPVEELIAGLLRDRRAPWPPPDLDQIRVEIVFLPPGEDVSRQDALFDSAAPGAGPLFSLNDLGGFLQAGESLLIQPETGAGGEVSIRGKGGVDEQVSPYLSWLIQRLPVVGADEEGQRQGSVAPVELEDNVVTPGGRFHIVLRGEVDRVVNRSLSATATRLFWFVGAVMAAIILTWLMIEIGVIRRIARLTRRAWQFPSWREESEFMAFNFSGFEGDDELGILAGRLDQLLARVKEDASRERIRLAQEKEQWHAVGHEIMSPLQSLLALYGNPDHPAYRYLARMQQALRVLYGSASPSEAFQSSALALETLDLDDFLVNIAANAPHIGVEEVHYDSCGCAVPVRADEYSLEDVIGHILKNAERYRVPGTPITIVLAPDGETEPGSVTVKIHNIGPAVAPEWMEKIFEYGFSGAPGVTQTTAEGRRGQGLFVAKTYMAKMGGTIHAANERAGVCFYLELKRADRQA